MNSDMNRKTLASNGRPEPLSTGCKARLATLPDDSQVILDSVEIEHNHGPNSDELKHEVFVYKLKDIVAKDPTIEAVHAVARAEVLYGKSPLATFKNLCKIVTDIQKRLGVTPKHAGMQGIHLRTEEDQLRSHGQPGDFGQHTTEMAYDTGHSMAQQ